MYPATRVYVSINVISSTFHLSWESVHDPRMPPCCQRGNPTTNETILKSSTIATFSFATMFMEKTQAYFTPQKILFILIQADLSAKKTLR